MVTSTHSSLYKASVYLALSLKQALAIATSISWGVRGRSFYTSFCCEKTSRLSSDEELKTLFLSIETLFEKHLRNDTQIAYHEMLRDNSLAMVKDFGRQRLIGSLPSTEEQLVQLLLVEGFCLFSEGSCNFSTPVGKARLLKLEAIPYLPRHFRLIGELSAENGQKLPRGEQKKADRLTSASRKADYWSEGDKKQLWNKDDHFTVSFFTWQKSLQRSWLAYVDEKIINPICQLPCSTSRPLFTSQITSQILDFLEQGKPAPYLFSSMLLNDQPMTLGEWGLWDSSFQETLQLHLVSQSESIQKPLEELFLLLGSFYTQLGIPYFWCLIKERAQNSPLFNTSVSKRDYQQACKKLTTLVEGQQLLERTLHCSAENLDQGPVLALCVEDSFGAVWPMAQLQMIVQHSLRSDPKKQQPSLETIVIYPFCNTARLIAYLLEVAPSTSQMTYPEQIRILVKEKQSQSFLWAYRLTKSLQKKGLRVTCDDRDYALKKKVWLAEQASVPFIAVVSPKEAEQKGLTWRSPKGLEFVAEEKIESLLLSLGIIDNSIGRGLNSSEQSATMAPVFAGSL